MSRDNDLTIANWLIKYGHVDELAKNILNFDVLDTAAAEALIEADYGKLVIEHIRTFGGYDYDDDPSGDDHPAIAELLIAKGFAKEVCDSLDASSGDTSFTHFYLRTAEQLIQLGFADFVARHSSSFFDVYYAQPKPES